PATVALFILAEPVVAMLFQRGQFTPFDTQQTALALRLYLLGLTFAAIDQPLIFAYYARQNTLTPALVGLLAVGFYLVAALLPALFRPLRMTDLVIANSVQLTGHALVMLWLVNRLATLRGRGLGPTVFKAIAGAGAMGLGLWLARPLVEQWLPPINFISQAIGLGLIIALGGGIYLLAAILLKMPDLHLLARLFRRFLPR
ncbi:MAG: murein biosynthesis integral membrane protein MurJ, partial [Anaerolineae bacterium]|nr:murein biosynthesis integral membrane protein MurJ [Anaerolineae bacterium]